MIDMTIDIVSDVVLKARSDLRTFAEYCWGFKNTWFHNKWYQTIQDYSVDSGLIIAPRNSAKSTCWGRVSPLWLLGRNPDLRIVLVSRTSSRAKDNLRFIKQSIESNDRVNKVFPFRELDGKVYGLGQSSPWGEDQLTVQNNRLDGMPSVYAVGLEGSISGVRADVIIVDDLIDQNNVMTENQRTKVIDFWNAVVVPTLNPSGRIFLVGCLTEDSRITMADGTWKYIKDCKVGDKVISYDSVETVEAMIPQGEAEVYELRTNNHIIEATANHPFLCDVDGEYKFVKLEDIKKGDQVIYYNKKKFRGKYVKSIKHIGKKEVYDLTISNTHNFVANGLVVHNTRYHSKDFYAQVLEDPMYKNNTFMFPAFELYESGNKKGEIVLIDVLDEEGNQVLDKEGVVVQEPISYWPAYWPVSALLKVKERMGTLAFNCLTENNKIITKTGLKKIKHLNVGDLVLTHSCSWKPIEHKFSKVSDEPIHSIYVYGEPEPLEVTASHKIWGFKSRQYKSKRLAPWNKGISDFVDDIIDNSLGWNEAKDIDNGDFMIYPIDKTIVPSKYDSEDFWWMVGLYLAEGCLNHSNHRIVFALASHETDYAERVVKTVARFGSKASIRMKETSMNVDFSNEEIYQFLIDFGHLAHGKHLTPEALHLPFNLQKAMWEGYVAGDGCVVINSVHNKAISVTSVSLDLLRGFKTILLRLGLVGFVGKTGKGGKRMIIGRLVNQRPTYRLWLNLETKRRRPAEIHNGYLFTRIRYKKIRFTGEKVYDIQVAEDHSFTTNQGIISNSQYMCDPSGYAGQLFDPDDLHFYNPDTLTAIWGNLDFVMSVDPNVTEDPESDNTAIVTAAVDRKRGQVYVMDIFAKPLGFVNQVKMLKKYGSKTLLNIGDKRFPVETRITKIGVEAVAYQRSLQQTGYLMGLPVVEIKQGNRNKEIRILGMQPHIENGRIMFPDPDKIKVPWWDKFYEEYCTFPKGRRDDMMDALEILVTMVSGTFGVSGIPWGPGGDMRGSREFMVPGRRIH